ncbi:14325_t:CDS:1 [Gigaspora margarita]|uniref:14325_t:CDS:1 n=1 Tax=Gigaspora margarita TaxID=4874 RepID=A0ABN7VNN4_GIGMA|nr:14325_t:CDS:1 [Gigaspora margarita]
MSLAEKSGEIQLSFNVSPDMKCCYENSLNEFYGGSPPYDLTIKIEELILPPKNSRKAAKFRKDPSSSSPPRPQNAFLLFRRDFYAKLTLKQTKMRTGEVSRLASEEWRKQPKEVLWFFEILEKLAKDKHSQEYPDYKYSPKKRCGKKSGPNNNTHRLPGETIIFSTPEIFNEIERKTSQKIYDFSEYINYDP